MAKIKYVDVPLEYYLLMSRITHDALDELTRIIMDKALFQDKESMEEFDKLEAWKFWEECAYERGLLRE